MFNLKILFIFFLVAFSHGQHNITVDDGDSSIVYAPSGSWYSVADLMDIGGTHMVTQDATGTATFTFTGVAIYFSSGLWPFTVSSSISLDGGSATLVDLTDHSTPEVTNSSETVASSVVWSQTGLDGTVKHTLVISLGAGQEYAVVDSLTYTTSDGITTTSASTSTAATSGSGSAASSSSNAASTAISSSEDNSDPTANKGISIVLGIVLTVFGLLVAGAIFWFYRRRKLRREAEHMWPGETVVSGDNLDWQAPPMMGMTTEHTPVFVGGGGGGVSGTPVSRSSSRSSARTLPPSENLAGRGARSKSIHRPYMFGTASSAPSKVPPTSEAAAPVAASVTRRPSKPKSQPRPTAGHEPTPLTSIPETSLSATRPKPLSFFYSNSPQDGARSLSPASSQGTLPTVAATSSSSIASPQNPSSSTDPWTFPQPVAFTAVS